MEKERDLLRRIGAETLYSAKGHFKAGDIRRQLVTYTIWLCAVVNVIGLLDFDQTVAKCFSIVGIFGTMALLIWNEGEGKNYRAKHKEIAEKYLALHKEIRKCYFLEECENQVVQGLHEKVIALGQSEKPDIPGLARRMAKKAIEGKDPETDNWFLEK